jgi:hypothetical protein
MSPSILQIQTPQSSNHIRQQSNTMGLIQDSLNLGRCDGEAPWLLVTNTCIPLFTDYQYAVFPSGVYIYGKGLKLPAHQDSVPPLNWETEVLPGWATDMDVYSDAVRFKTGVMNNPPLYMALNTALRAWAVGTDIFTLNAVRNQWKMPIGTVSPTTINRDGTTSLLGISQLPAHSLFEMKRHGSRWHFNMKELYDPVFDVLQPQITDPGQAGRQFTESLRAAVAEITKDDREVATLLSGGIDSGAVTTFAVLSGKKVTAYSAGSPWGNEHEQAQELADFLGIPLIRIDLSADEILAAIPASIRALGTANRVAVDVSLVISAVMRRGIIKEQRILTGYGADPLLLGLPPDSVEVEALTREIISEVDLARHCCELTDAVARTWNKKLSHPFWHRDVIKLALDIHPHCKVRGGREKAFLRAAMEQYMPKSCVWRKKIGIHLGGGLQGGLDSHFGGVEQKSRIYAEIFEFVVDKILYDPAAKIDEVAPQI